MNRALPTGLFVLVIAGCQLPPERMPLQPLPENAAPLPYAELLTRARMEATAATEAFYVSRWVELEDAARGLEQTARFLPKAVEVPAKSKDRLTARAKELEAEAGKLRDAAKAQQVRDTNEILQRINLKVRELRIED